MKTLNSLIVCLLLASPCVAQLPLRQSTASQEVPLPRMLDATDGDTEESGLTISNTDIKLWKSGATDWVSKNSGGATISATATGLYYTVLDATDTATLGPLVIDVHESGAQSVRLYCVVLPAAYYDALFGAGAAGNVPANVTQAAGAALGTAAAGYLPADARKVDGENLSTHATGYYPADLRMTAGNSLAAATSGYVPTEGGGGGGSDSTLILDTTTVTTINATSVRLDCTTDIPADKLTDAMALVYDDDNFQGRVRILGNDETGAGGEPNTIVIDVASSAIFTDGSIVKIIATPPQLDALVSEAGGTVDPAILSPEHTWRFDRANQIQSPTLINEVVGGTFLVQMDFTNALSDNASISSISSVTVTDVAGKTEPTVTTSVKSTDQQKVIITVNAASASTYTTGYRFNVTIITTDSQTIVRRGLLVLQ